MSPKGNISISIGFISDRPVEALSVKTGLVVARTIKEVFGKNIGIKWPNDLILNKKKIGGILTETENSKDSFINVVGVGLNLQIKAEEGHWGSLNEKLQSQAKDIFLQKLPNDLLDSIEKGFGNNWVNEWEKICVHLSEEVKLRNTDETVIFSGINSDGSMIAIKDGVSVRVDESSISIEGVY